MSRYRRPLCWPWWCRHHGIHITERMICWGSPRDRRVLRSIRADPTIPRVPRSYYDDMKGQS